MLLKVDRLPNAVGKQPSIPLIYLGRKWTLNRWWWWWWWWWDSPLFHAYPISLYFRRISGLHGRDAPDVFIFYKLAFNSLLLPESVTLKKQVPEGGWRQQGHVTRNSEYTAPPPVFNIYYISISSMLAKGLLQRYTRARFDFKLVKQLLQACRAAFNAKFGEILQHI